MEHTETDDAARVAITRHYPVAPEKVWRAWTDPQALSQWFGPTQPATVTIVEVDLSEGGRYRFAFAGPTGEMNEVSGVYQEVKPHRRLVFSWAFRSTPERVSRVSIDFTPLHGGCELRFVHDRFFNETARANHARGWQDFFVSLDGFLGD